MNTTRNDVLQWPPEVINKLRPSPLPPLAGGEGMGEGGDRSAQRRVVSYSASAPSPPSPLPRSGGEGRTNASRFLAACFLIVSSLILLTPADASAQVRPKIQFDTTDIQIGF